MKCKQRYEVLIERLKSVGYGYAEFAKNVEKQGWCSAKQQATMERMLRKISHHGNTGDSCDDDREEDRNSEAEAYIDYMGSR